MKKNDSNNGEKKVKRDNGWFCPDCDSLLGISSPDMSEMKIKSKDVYLYIRPDTIIRVLHKCLNKITYDEKELNENSWWICQICGKALGHVTKQNGETRIKYKDLYIYHRSDFLKVLCKQCGRENEITYS